VAAAARLAFVLQHHIERGRLRIWIDEALVLEQPISSKVKQDLKLLKIRSGRVEVTVSAAPGKRHIRVEVRSGDDFRVKETTGTFKAGQTLKLEAKQPRVGGGLALEWK
jgi:hypothetical protein